MILKSSTPMAKSVTSRRIDSGASVFAAAAGITLRVSGMIVLTIIASIYPTFFPPIAQRNPLSKLSRRYPGPLRLLSTMTRTRPSSWDAKSPLPPDTKQNEWTPSMRHTMMRWTWWWWRLLLVWPNPPCLECPSCPTWALSASRSSRCLPASPTPPQVAVWATSSSEPGPF